MNNKSSKVWLSVLDLTQKEIGAERFNLWFKNVHMLVNDTDLAKVVVPNPFVKSWFEDNFSSMLQENLRIVTNKQMDLQITVDKDGFSKKSTEIPGNNREDIVVANSENSNISKSKTIHTGKMLTLEDFVVGDCNRLAYASALEIIKPQDCSFNALFIHGPVGVGKTHLLQGIRNTIKRQNNGVSVAYLSAESWTNEFIYSLQKGKLELFRNKYRNLDILLIDDVHFVSKKQGVQEELLHTFNTLHESSKKVIFASDAHPKFINKLKESLSSRFMAGMVTKVETPDYKTAYLILNSKLQKLKQEFPEAVLEYIASTFINSIRELECALTTVIAVSSITKRRVDMNLAKEALEDHVTKKSVSTSIKEIEDVVSKHFNVTHTELHSSKRTISISRPRQIAMYLSALLTNFSRQQIGEHFGGKKHTTVIHAVKTITAKLNQDADMRRQVELLKDEISKG